MLNKKMVMHAVGLGVSLLLLAGPQASFAEKNYSEYGSGSIPMNSYGECWETAAGLPPNEMCGGKMAAPMMSSGDSDHDGLADDKDKCPDTMAGVPVNAMGCDLDSDGDGVADYKDMCPRTESGSKVNAKGCPDVIVFNDVLFGHDSSTLKMSAQEKLDHAATAIQNSGSNNVMVIGHTDSSGDASYNQSLSTRRAGSVADYLSNKGISRSSMTVSGMGESKPVADNSTSDGRSKNRRVEIHMGK